MALLKPFSALPSSIKNQLTSEMATALITTINYRLNVFGDDLRLLPSAITRVVTGELMPREFIPTIQKEIGISYEEARGVASEVLDKILAPVLGALKNEGVDAATIVDGAPSFAPAEGGSASGGKAPAVAKAFSQGEQAPTLKTTASAGSSPKSSPISGRNLGGFAPQKAEQPAVDMPFVLHRHEEVEIPRPQPTPAPRPRVTPPHIPSFAKAPEGTPAVTQAPAGAKAMSDKSEGTRPKPQAPSGLPVMDVAPLKKAPMATDLPPALTPKINGDEKIPSLPPKPVVEVKVSRPLNEPKPKPKAVHYSGPTTPTKATGD